MPHRSHLTVIEEYYTHHGRLIKAEQQWLECKYMQTFDRARPLTIPEMIAELRGKKA